MSIKAKVRGWMASRASMLISARRNAKVGAFPSRGFWLDSARCWREEMVRCAAECRRMLA